LRLLKNVKPLGEMKRLYFPFNIGNWHWALFYVDVEGKKIIYLDSMLENEMLPASKKTLNNLLFFLQGHIQGDLTVQVAINAPQQGNNFDCGLYVIFYVLALALACPLNFIPIQGPDSGLLRRAIKDFILKRSSSERTRTTLDYSFPAATELLTRSYQKSGSIPSSSTTACSALTVSVLASSGASPLSSANLPSLPPVTSGSSRKRPPSPSKGNPYPTELISVNSNGKRVRPSRSIRPIVRFNPCDMRGRPSSVAPNDSSDIVVNPCWVYSVANFLYCGYKDTQILTSASSAPLQVDAIFFDMAESNIEALNALISEVKRCLIVDYTEQRAWHTQESLMAEKPWYALQHRWFLNLTETIYENYEVARYSETLPLSELLTAIKKRFIVILYHIHLILV
jgi:hypothetical protein